MPIKSSDYVLYAVENIILLNPDTLELEAMLKNVKDTTWNNTATTNYATTRGVKIASIKSEKESNIETSNATITDGLLALQTGTDMETVTNSTEIFYTDTFTISADSGETAFTAIGTALEEIKFLYVLGADGSVVDTLTQAAVASGTEFTYTSGTKAIATSGLDDGTSVMAIYNATVATSKKFVNNAYKFPPNVKAIVNALFKETCGAGNIYSGQLIMNKAEVSTETTYDIPEVGDPSVNNLSLMALKPCISDNLWELNIYDAENDIV